MLKLNGIPENRARGNQEFTRNLLQEVLAEAAPSSDAALQSFHESAGELSLKLGLLEYGLEEEPERVRELLRQAAGHLTPALFLRASPAPATSRNPWEALQYVSVIYCFGQDEDLRALAQLRPDQYRNPVRAAHDVLGQYLPILLKHVGGGEIEPSALARLVEVCEASSASKDDYLFLLPAAQGLAAIAATDEDKWNYALARLISAHSREARRGELKLLPAGFICFHALMLAKMGIDRGMDCRAVSDYLPLFLLEEKESE